MITIYGVYRSRATRPIWVLEELGVDFRHVPVIQGYRLPDPGAADAPLNTTSPAFLQISPAGAVPVMEDDGFVLSESLAITHYLARKFGGTLAPVDPLEEARMQELSLYAATSIEPAALEIMFASRGDAVDGSARAAIEAAAQRLRRPLAVLEARLSVTPHPVGGRFTVADINLAECLRYAQSHPTLLAGFPALNGWLEAVQARPAFVAMWQRREAEPA